LIELVVVVGIILVLMGLVLAVSTIVIQQAESRQMKSVFANLNASISEYEQAIGRKITYEDRFDSLATPNGSWDIPFNVTFDAQFIEYPYNTAGSGYSCNCSSSADSHGWEKYIVRLLQLLDRTDSSEEILARIDPNLLVQVKKTNGTPLPQGQTLASIIDPWGIPLAVVFPGRMWQEGDDDFIRDSDGTIRTALENKVGVCKNGTLLFISAGPDGDIGCIKCVNEVESNRYQASIDNIYSYEPGSP
jgi:type II secretory pathway pseudopilin PulG